MDNNKHWFVWEIAVITFMLWILFILLVFLTLWDKGNEEFRNIEQNKISTYMESIFLEKKPYKIWRLNIPWLGLEPNIEYNAVCHNITEECWKITSFIIKNDIFYAYDDSFFLIFTSDKITSYSLFELDGLLEEREILLDLKENPRLIFE